MDNQNEVKNTEKTATIKETRILVIEQDGFSEQKTVSYDSENQCIETSEGGKVAKLKISDQKPFKRTVIAGVGTINYFLLKRLP